MAVIKPTITLTSNASSATTDPGPLSVALSLSATDSLTISGHVETRIYNFEKSSEKYLDSSHGAGKTVVKSLPEKSSM